MESLLRWSIENSTPQDDSSSDAPPIERKNLDPAIIDHILGKPDAVQMKDDMAIALDVSKSESERVEALDHLELVSVELLSHVLDFEIHNRFSLLSLLTTQIVGTALRIQVVWLLILNFGRSSHVGSLGALAFTCDSQKIHPQHPSSRSVGHWYRCSA